MRLGHDEKIETIKKVPLFGHCTKKELAAVARLADEIDLPAGKVLTRQGERGHEFLVLIEGTADVERDGEKVAELGAGDFFGEIALVSHIPRTATVTASTPIRALVVAEHDFRSLLSQSPDISLKVLQALAERLPASHTQ
jgi:CRP/FNR family transcriptional regulator, cyclic AMP receptor protein